MKLDRALYLRMLAHALQERPRECVGILAGLQDGEPCQVFYGTNVAKNPANTYQLGPKEQLGLEQAIEGAGLVPLAIYHSHPNSPPIISDFDRLTAFNSSEVAYLIIGLASLPDVTVRLYWIGATPSNDSPEIVEVV